MMKFIKYGFVVFWLVLSWVMIGVSFEMISSASSVGNIIGFLFFATILFSNWELGGYTFDDKDDTNLWFKFFNLFKRKEK